MKPAFLRSKLPQNRSRAAALLIALIFLVLLSAVVLALFSSSQTDRQNAGAFASGLETMRLADSAVNLIQAQIRDASIQPRVGWASQPGMVRTFDTAGNVTAYKLFSSDVMVVPNYGLPQITTEFSLIQNWNAGATDRAFNATFCDLNAPVIVPRPDPLTPDPNDTTLTPVFPIADPAAIGAVDGFSATSSVAGTVLGTTQNRRLPMPVRWIYVLKDGQLVAPDSSSTSARTAFTGSTLPSSSNPIVGRIAFWTDDETAKLNINTASEGSFWDTPKASTWSELRMALSMPVQGEYQRMVGHPATTSLSPVLRSFDPLYTRPQSLIDSTAEVMANAVANPDEYYAPFVRFYDLTPRVFGSLGDADKSSKAGAQRTSASGLHASEKVNQSVWPTDDQNNTPQGAPLISDADRLYVTTDEYLFKPDRTVNLGFSAQEINRAGFLLTSSSRAPETTLFGTPRISLWPQQTQRSDRNVKDSLINLCATVGGVQYSFQRQIAAGSLASANQPADSGVADFQLSGNQRLTSLLRELMSTPIPGFGASFATKWGSGTDAVLAQTFDLVRANTNVDYTDLGNTVYTYSVTTRGPKTKVASSNLSDSSQGPRAYVIPVRVSNDVKGQGRYIGISQANIIIMARRVENTHSGNLTQVGDGFTATPSTAPAGPIQSQRTLAIQAMLVFQPYISVPGGTSIFPGGEIEVEGLNNLRINNTPMGPLRATSQFGSFMWGGNHALTDPNMFFVWWNRGASNVNSSGFYKEPVSGGTDKQRHYPFVSPVIDTTGLTSIAFGGGRLTVILRNYAGTEEVARYTMTFGSVAALPLPQHIGTNAANETDASFAGLTPSLTTASNAQTSNLSIDRANQPNSSNYNSAPGSYLSPWKRMIARWDDMVNLSVLYRPGDIVLGMEMDPNDAWTRGDFRLLGLGTSFQSFRPSHGYGQVSVPFVGVDASDANTTAALNGRFAMSFRSEAAATTILGWNRQPGWKLRRNNSPPNGRMAVRDSLDSIVSGSQVGTLIAGFNFTSDSAPIVPAGLQGARLANNSLGDWTSGYGNAKDGAFFSPPDPGSASKYFGGYYEDKYLDRVAASLTFEPNRLVTSAGIFGQIIAPDGAGRLQGWQTLLFNSSPAAGQSHPGFSSPPDHLFLDNFWMPVAEPYPISETFSTAGKVNLNQEIQPFTNITRNTALRGVLTPLMVSGVEDTLANGTVAGTYKRPGFLSPISNRIRSELHMDQTIQRFLEKFQTGEIYRSATEVSTIPLVPTNSNGSAISPNTFWNGRRVSSDTLREQPYLALLSRITTKSNTFTVHYRVQALRQVPGSGRNWNEWNEGRDQVTGEFRGSTTIERFLDPNAEVPDYTSVDLAGDYRPIDALYRWRVLSNRQFAP